MIDWEQAIDLIKLNLWKHIKTFLNLSPISIQQHLSPMSQFVLQSMVAQKCLAQSVDLDLHDDLLQIIPSETKHVSLISWYTRKAGIFKNTFMKNLMELNNKKSLCKQKCIKILFHHAVCSYVFEISLYLN